MNAIIGSVVFLAWIIGIGMAYKNRHSIARWLNDTTLTVTDEKRKKYLQRRMEDDTDELKEIEKRINK